MRSDSKYEKRRMELCSLSQSGKRTLYTKKPTTCKMLYTPNKIPCRHIYRFSGFISIPFKVSDPTQTCRWLQSSFYDFNRINTIKHRQKASLRDLRLQHNSSSLRGGRRMEPGEGPVCSPPGAQSGLQEA